VPASVERRGQRLGAYGQGDGNLSQRLEAIPGIGLLGASALVASIPDPHIFRSGRECLDRALDCALALPKQNSSGGKERLGPISKAGNRSLRKLLVVGALSVIKRAKLLGHSRYPWLTKLMERRSVRVAAIALANKNARPVGAMMARNESYRATQAASA
jgi:transposase